MKTSKNGIELIKKHEGLRLAAYKCPAGVWTIGYGHTGKDVYKGLTITEQQATELLEKDLQTAENAINKQKLNINQNQFDALASFVFNVGVKAFEQSSLLNIARLRPDSPNIAIEFSKWKYSNSIVLPGLVARRKEESELYFK